MKLKNTLFTSLVDLLVGVTALSSFFTFPAAGVAGLFVDFGGEVFARVDFAGEIDLLERTDLPRLRLLLRLLDLVLLEELVDLLLEGDFDDLVWNDTIKFTCILLLQIQHV